MTFVQNCAKHRLFAELYLFDLFGPIVEPLEIG